MPEYVLGHDLKGEGKRLALMSELLDPMHRRYLQSLDVVKSGARTLEVGCGNGSISAWLARQVAPDGRAIAVDLDLSLVDVHLPNLELRKEDITARPVDPCSFDLVTARAVLHHVADAKKAIANLVASLRPGGAILLIEPDFLPVTIAEPPEVRAFWSGWLCMVTWARNRLSNRSHSGTEIGGLGYRENRWHRRNCNLQRDELVGGLLDTDDQRTSPGLDEFRQA